ncbi:hypothetical protein [Amycolatopsis sp. NPDC051128]|uniref:hypothetical protein n=1 Tax=Amycolatopsis sp. NPDC051128 TaxID=3155412 RepID=UPI00341ACD7E
MGRDEVVCGFGEGADADGGRVRPPAPAAAIHARQDALITGLGPDVGDRKPFTCLAPGENAAATFTAGALERLRTIKRNRDPHGVFRSNFPVLAGTGGATR